MKTVFTKSILLLICLFAANYIQAQNPSNPIWSSKEYSVYSDSITQGVFTAKAISSTELKSNYRSPVNEFQSSKISFKFSINRKDNEMKFGLNHHFNASSISSETPLIKFGEQLKDTTKNTENVLGVNTKLKIRLDMRSVLNDFNTKGFFVTVNGDKIYKEDFKELYVAGETLPMTWDFDNLHWVPELEMKDPDGDGIYETEMILNAPKDKKITNPEWTASQNTSAFPQYKSDYLISDAVYNLALEEMMNAVEPDSTFRTGKEWAGVWTRDISYSIILSMAYLQPKVAMNSLLKKVNLQERIIQDTGTGGAYPVSTDRMIWAVAAFEIYKATGDKEWLKKSYRIIKNSIDDDVLNAHDKETGMVRGESSFLDWREQTYPKWMQPADIFESENLGTNVVHFQANMVLSEMASLLNKKPESIQYKKIAETIKTGINRYLWMEDEGYYAQYFYGRNNKIQSPRSEALGEALSVLFGVADSTKQKSVIANVPVTAYGISCIYPQIPTIPSYHNNAVWPFVQSYWALASAKAGNEKSVMESFSSIYRAAAMFATNKENFVADNGDFAGTVINSSNMLWSLSGSLSLVHKILFGIEFKSKSLEFHPFIPQSLKGNRTLSNFKYRNAILTVSVEGYGNQIKTFLLDGTKSIPEISSTLSGKHTVKIVMANNDLSDGKINKVENYTTLTTPTASFTLPKLSWQKVDGASEYKVLKNGKALSKTSTLNLPVFANYNDEFQVIALDKNGKESFASEPVTAVNKKFTAISEAEEFAKKADFPYKGFSGSGFIETSKTVNSTVTFQVEILEAGHYALDFRYANGNGPTNTNNKCAIRTLKEGKKIFGTVVLPQRGENEWSNWGFSNSVKVELVKGKYSLTLSLDPANENMNGETNQAMIDYLRISRLE